jgi:hypothetical protein
MIFRVPVQAGADAYADIRHHDLGVPALLPTSLPLRSNKSGALSDECPRSW